MALRRRVLGLPLCTRRTLLLCLLPPAAFSPSKETVLLLEKLDHQVPDANHPQGLVYSTGPRLLLSAS